MKVLSSNPKDTDPYQFDTMLKKLETTKKIDATSSRGDASASVHSGVHYSSAGVFEQSYDTRQTFVDQGGRGDHDSPKRQTSIENFIDQQAAAAANITGGGQQSVGGGSVASEQIQGNTLQTFTRHESPSFLDHTGVTERNLPEAILKLDRKHAIPRPRHKNDILVAIEASTVDKRDLMTRPGVRCAASLPVGVVTTSLDCIGRVVQLSTHARAIHGIEVDDRVAAIYPFMYEDEKSNNHQYTFVDAALVVAVPRNLDAAMASCMTRLYTTAFQAIQLGHSEMHDRYNLNQLQGQSLLVQDGDTELGRALIELAVELGASQIFATGPSHVHDRLRDMGATPLGAETFGWELFVEEKLSMIFIQSLPTPETFESFASLLDAGKTMVYVQPPNRANQDESGNVIFSSEHDRHSEFLHDLANKAKAAVASAKFDCQLTCSNQFETYEGVWASCKQDQILFKKDLRFLLTLLAEGKLAPQVEERVCLEDVPGIQDRIELEGTKGTIVCLPTTLFEKKASMVTSLKHKGKNGTCDRNSTKSSPVINSFAIDSGYTRPKYDTLSDFHFLTPKPFEDESVNGPNPFLEQATSFTSAAAASGKDGDAFIAFKDSFATWDGEGDHFFKDLQDNSADEKAKEELQERKKEEGAKVMIGVTTTETTGMARKERLDGGNHLNRRAQAALQRKKDMRARMRKAQQEKVKSSQSEGNIEVDANADAVTSKHPTSTAWKKQTANNSSPNEVQLSNSRPVTRNFQPTPEWLKGVRPQSSTDKRNTAVSRPTPEWLKESPQSESKHADYVPSKYRFSEPPVKSISGVDGRDDVSAVSDFKSVMSKWKAVEQRKA